MTTDRKEMAATATARSDIYGLLATLLRSEVTLPLLKELKAPQLTQVLTGLGIELGADFFDKPEDELLEDLAVEFTQLFIGPGGSISAHASVYIESQGGDWGNLWGKETVKVKAFIEEAGLEYEDDFKGIPDHISVELEFLQKLAKWEAEKWAQGDAENALYCLGIEKRFLDDHLNKWAPDLCETIRAKAEMPFYARVADLMEGFLAFDREKMDETLSQSQ